MSPRVDDLELADRLDLAVCNAPHAGCKVGFNCTCVTMHAAAARLRHHAAKASRKGLIARLMEKFR